LESREFRSPEEIDAAIAKLQRRIQDLEKLNVEEAVMTETGAIKVARSDVRETIRDVFRVNSPEFKEHEHIRIWAGSEHMNMSAAEVLRGTSRGRVQVSNILKGLIGRLAEKRSDLAGRVLPAPSTYFDRLNLHPRIREVSRDRFMDGYPWDAVFAAARALVNYVKECSNRDDSSACRERGVGSDIEG